MRLRRLPMRLRRLRLAPLRRLWRLRRLRRLLLVLGAVPPLLRRNHVPTTLTDISGHGRVLLDPARSAFPAALGAAAANYVDKCRRAS